MTYAKQTFKCPSSLIKIERIRALLSARPMTVKELAAALPSDPRTVYSYLGHLRADVHISGWARAMPRNYPIPVYAWGAGKDAKKPPRVTTTECGRRRRRELKMDAEKFMELEKRRKAAQIQPFRDPLVEAMYGKAA